MIKTTFFLLAVLFVSPASAEIYQYTDESGNMRFTDNLGDVPEIARPEIKAFYEIPLTVLNENQENTGDRTSGPAEDKTWEAGVKKNAEELKAEQATLEQQYESLMSEKNQIGEPPPESATHADKRAYQARAEVLNRKIAAYEEARKKFENKVDRFNESIGVSN